MTLIDLFREFGAVSTREGYSPSSRILYHTMLWCWNEQRRPEVTTMSTVQLYTLAGLAETTFREAFAYLADRGWVKRVKSRKRGLTAWLMRDRCGKSAPPAGFPMSPAQRTDDEGGRIARGDSSPDTSKEQSNVQSASGNDVGGSGVNPKLSGIQGAAAPPNQMDRGDVPDDIW